jgi:3-methyl-2-oxobutanoate hydroxymethyltransferase
MRKNKLTSLEMKSMKAAGEQITWITAYDLPLAFVAEQSGVDMILVGDSGGMVQLGYQSTNPVTMDEMIVLAKAARRGAPNTFLVGDMPQGSYEVSDEDAIRNALRFIKEAGCDAIKLEGGRRMQSRVRAISDAGILVFGHLGLTPQSAASFGGYRVQGKTCASFDATVEDALSLEAAGICGLLLEAMPSAPAGQIARRLSAPVLGIGAGNEVDGQLVIMHDVLGFYQAFRPWFAKCYVALAAADFAKYIGGLADLRKVGRDERRDGLMVLAQMAVERYVREVRQREFPSADYCYPIQDKDLTDLRRSKYWIATPALPKAAS